MNWKDTIIILLLITQVREQLKFDLPQGLGVYFKSCILVTLTRLSLEKSQKCGSGKCLTFLLHRPQASSGDKCLQMTGMSAQKMPERVSQHKPCSSVHREVFMLFCPFHIRDVPNN